MIHVGINNKEVFVTQYVDDSCEQVGLVRLFTYLLCTYFLKFINDPCNYLWLKTQRCLAAIQNTPHYCSDLLPSNSN